VLLVYDITKPATFDNLSNWINDVHRFSDQEIPMCIVGNKIDMEYQRQVTVPEAEEFAKRYACKFVEASALSSLKVEDVFLQLVDQIIDKYVEAKLNWIALQDISYLYYNRANDLKLSAPKNGADGSDIVVFSEKSKPLMANKHKGCPC